MTLLSKLRTRKLRTFVRPETHQTRVVRNHKCLVVQLESIECLRFRLDEEDLLSVGVLVGEHCYVAVTSKRCAFDVSHEFDGD